MPCFFKKMGWQSLLHGKMNLNINYDKSNLQQNNIKWPKHPNSAKKMPKSNMKFPNVLTNVTKKR